jgi:hypothetical protein
MRTWREPVDQAEGTGLGAALGGFLGSPSAAPAPRKKQEMGGLLAALGRLLRRIFGGEESSSYSGRGADGGPRSDVL